MKDKIKQIQQSLNKLITFERLHPIDLPENLIHPSADKYGANVSIHGGSAPNEAGKQKILAVVGDAFGRDGWEAELDYRGATYTWRKTLNDVNLTILEAETVQRREKFPVSPQKFPIMLEDEKRIVEEDEDPAF